MIILYLKDSPDINTCTFLQAIPDVMVLEESGSQAFIEGQPEPVINDLTKAGWFAVPEQYIEPEGDLDGDIIPREVCELNLVHFTPDNLPHSQFVGKLIAVNLSAIKPATVRRVFYGETYDVNCLVGENAAQLWISGKLLVDDFVIVSYITEVPFGTKVNLPILVDKINKTW